MHKHPPEKWWRHKVTKARSYKLHKPYENIHIGSDPCDGYTPEDAQKFDAILNVSDSECAFFHPSRPDQKMYWYPLNELGYWGYAHFLVTKKILDYHYDRGDKVLIHCHAGAYRSVRTGIWWLVGRGFTPEEAMAMDWGKPADRLKEEYGENWKDHVFIDVVRGNAPKNLVEMYARMKTRPTDSFANCLLVDRERSLIDNTTDVLSQRYSKTIQWWSWFKIWLRDKKDRFTYWRKGFVRVKIGEYTTVVCKPEEVQDQIDSFREHMARIDRESSTEALADELLPD